MDAATRRLVRERADNRCEYCQRHQDESPLAALQIEHVLPRKHGGGDVLDNLALACIDCNLGKGSNLTGLIPIPTMPIIQSHCSIQERRRGPITSKFKAQ